MSGGNILVGVHPGGWRLFAAIDPFARFVEPGTRSSRLGALLAPYKDVEAAKQALEAAGCEPDTIEVWDGASR